MAKTLTQFVGDIRAYVSRGKLKPARKTLDKALRAGAKGPALDEVVLELLLAEGGGRAAARHLADLAKAEARLPAAIEHCEAHLRSRRDDHAVRDALWEIYLATGAPADALRHVQALHRAKAVDGPSRAKSLLERKDVVGALGIFLLASVGAVKTDRMKLADRLLSNAQGAELLAGAVEALHAAGHEDGPIHYVLAQMAQRSGDRDRFLEFARKAFEEDPDKVWTWSVDNVPSRDRVEIALHNDSLKHTLQAVKGADPHDIVDVAQKSRGDGVAAKVLRGFALLLTERAQNACRVLEGLVGEKPEVAAPIARLLQEKAPEWSEAREVRAAVVAAALADDAAEVESAIDGLLEVPESERGEAWERVAPRLLEMAAGRHDLRHAYGVFRLARGAPEAAADLLTDPEHLPIAREWAEAGQAEATVLLRAARLAEERDVLADHAEWLLRAGRGDAALMTKLGRILSGSTVSAETALESAAALVEQGQKAEAADLLSRLPLDRHTGQLVDDFLNERRLQDDRAFHVVSFRAGLALGDANRVRRLFKSVSTNVQSLAKEAAQHADAGRVLAEVLIAHEKGEVAVGILDARREAGDDARSLLPLADALAKSAPRLAMGRLLRAKLLLQLGRDVDAVRDLRTIPANAAEVDEAFRLLGELAESEAAGEASLGRADTHIGRKEYRKAVDELMRSRAPAVERLERFVAVCKEKGDFDAAHKGRADCLLQLARIPEAADAHLRRFSCPDANPASVAGDLQEVAGAALQSNDLATASRVLEQLPDQVSDGAERAISVIGEDQRPPLLILKSKLLLQLGRTEDAVKTLADLVRADAASRPQAAQALEAIIESGQARPDADFALAEAFDAMGRTPDALKTLVRLYEDDLTRRENVVGAASKLVRKVDDPDVRLFLGRVCLDLRDAKGATEHAVYARRLRPAARRDCVELLRRALDLDAFAPETHFALAEAHLAGDEADDAVRHFRAAVEVDRDRAEPAIAAMEESAPRSKHPALLWLAVGTTYAEFLKDHGNAVAAFSRGLEADPTTGLKVPLLLGRGDSHAALREDDKAFDDFDEASRHDLLERRYYEFLRARHRKRVLEKAEAAQSRAREDFAAAVEAVGRFIRLGQAQDAVNTAQAALSQAPQHLGARYLVGVALHAAGRYDAAAQVLEAVRAAAGADTQVGRAARMLLAESHLDSGDRASARACLTEIESVDAAYPGLSARRAALAPPADDPHAPPPLYIRPEFPRPTD